jgi:hypothetical protein
MDSVRVERNLSPDPISSTLGSVMSSWYCYDESIWGPWDSISPDGENNFPATGPVKSQYDYAGGDAVTRVMATAPRLTPGAGTSKITWTAAAKPFGYLEAGGKQIKPNEYGIVLPAFREVRLIPIDASSAPAGGASIWTGVTTLRAIWMITWPRERLLRGVIIVWRYWFGKTRSSGRLALTGWRSIRGHARSTAAEGGTADRDGGIEE